MEEATLAKKFFCKCVKFTEKKREQGFRVGPVLRVVGTWLEISFGSISWVPLVTTWVKEDTQYQ